MMSAPAAMQARATEAWYVSMQRRREANSGRARMNLMVGRTRASSSVAERGVACGRVDSPPMSRIVTEWARRDARVGRREVGEKVGVWTPSWEKESGVRFRMAMRWVLRVGREVVIRGLGVSSEGEESGEVGRGVKRVRGVCGDRGVGFGGRFASWDEKSSKVFGWGSKESGMMLAMVSYIQWHESVREKNLLAERLQYKFALGYSRMGNLQPFVVHHQVIIEQYVEVNRPRSVLGRFHPSK